MKKKNRISNCSTLQLIVDLYKSNNNNINQKCEKRKNTHIKDTKRPILVIKNLKKIADHLYLDVAKGIYSTQNI